MSSPGRSRDDPGLDPAAAGLCGRLAVPWPL